MADDFAEIRDELRAVARDLLGQENVDWGLLAGAGWLGLEVPEALDGAGATFAEVAVVLEEMGRAAASSPYLGAVVLGVGALNLAEPGRGRDELLREAASGGVVLATALAGDAEDLSEAVMPFRIERSPGGLRLHGRAAFVPGATQAGLLLLPALDPAGAPALVAVMRQAVGLSVAAQPVLDATRRLGLVTADGVGVPGAAVWG